MKKIQQTTDQIMSNHIKTVSLLVLAAGFANISYGLGVRNPDQDAAATARGEAFVATADNPSAIYYNPAGISQLEGVNFRAGADLVSLYDHQYSPGGAAHTVESPVLIPQFYFTSQIKNTPVTVGLGVYSPYGLSIEWPHSTTFSTVGTKASLQYICFNPVVSWQVFSNLSIAGGATINYAQTDLRFDVPNFFALSVPLPGAPGSQERFKGCDTVLGFNLGALYKPTEEISLGLSYRSETIMNFRGPASVNGTLFPAANSVGAQARFALPQNVVAGISYRPTPLWNLEFDADWTDWNQLKNVSVVQSPIPGVPINLPFNYKSSFFFEWGVTRYFGAGWQASAGYIYSQNSVPDSGFYPLIPDSDRHIWSLGIGKKYKHFSWDAAYQLAWGPARTVSGSPGAAGVPAGFGQTADGTYEFLSHAFLISVGYHF